MSNKICSCKRGLNWLIFVQGPVRGFVYTPAGEIQYELLNFTTKFGTKYAIFRKKLCEINCMVVKKKNE